MNQQGVFITFMVFLLVASVLALHGAARRSDSRQEEMNISEAAFNNVNNAFNNLYEEVVSLNKEGYARVVQQRSMPFQYNFNGNSIILSQRVPVRKPIMKAYIDALNIYSIFVNSETGSADLNISTKTVQNEAWGAEPGYTTDFNYAILPQCLLYDINGCCQDVNLMVLRELADDEHGCTGGFDYQDMNIVDINISINSSGCAKGNNITGLLEKQEDQIPGSPLPYYKITINEINPLCPGSDPDDCPVTGSASGKTEAFGHFDWDEDTIDSLKVSCNGEDWLRVKLGKESEGDKFPVVIYNWLSNRPVDVDLNLTFDQRVELFYFTGFSISVEKKNFPIRRSS